MAKEYNALEHSVVQALLKPDATHRYETSDFVEALVFGLHRELSRVYWNWNQEDLENRKDWQLNACGFEYRRYFWGDCDCGADSPVHAKDCHAIVEHDAWNKKRLEAISDPVTEEEGGPLTLPDGMPNILRYGRRISFDCDREDAWIKDNPHPPCTCRAEESWVARDHHLPTCSPQLPNIKFGEVVINWYKHMGRGMSTNVDWSEKRWREWFDGALQVIRLYDFCGQHGHQKLRDEDAGRKPFSTDDRVQCKDCKYCVAFGANKGGAR